MTNWIILEDKLSEELGYISSKQQAKDITQLSHLNPSKF